MDSIMDIKMDKWGHAVWALDNINKGKTEHTDSDTNRIFWIIQYSQPVALLPVNVWISKMVITCILNGRSACCSTFTLNRWLCPSSYVGETDFKCLKSQCSRLSNWGLVRLPPYLKLSCKCKCSLLHLILHGTPPGLGCCCTTCYTM